MKISLVLIAGLDHNLLNQTPDLKTLVSFPHRATLHPVTPAGYLSIQGWWALANSASTKADIALLPKLMCIIAGIMIALTALITAAVVRRWYVILFGEVYVGEPVAELVVRSWAVVDSSSG